MGSGGNGSVSPESVGGAPESTGAAATRTGSGGGGGSGALATWTGGGSGGGAGGGWGAGRGRRSGLSVRLWLGLLSAAAAAGKERPDRFGLLRRGVGHHGGRRITDHIRLRSVGTKARQQIRVVRSFHGIGPDLIDLHFCR